MLIDLTGLESNRKLLQQGVSCNRGSPRGRVSQPAQGLNLHVDLDDVALLQARGENTHGISE